MGTLTTNEFIYKPAAGASGTSEKNSFDAGMDNVDTRLGREVWIGDPLYGATLQTAVTAIGGDEVILHIPNGTWTLTADLTIPANIALAFERGALIDYSIYALLISGAVIAGAWQIFTGTAGSVVADYATNPVQYNEWWVGAGPNSPFFASIYAVGASILMGDGYGSITGAVAGTDYPPVGTPVCPSTTEMGYLTGVTSDIQAQINALSGGVLSPTPGLLNNGKLVVSVATNDVTVAIKDLAGDDPSAGSPVVVRIGDTLRTLTAALSLTLTDGTNWFGSGSTGLATYTIDYFCYVGWRASDTSIFIGMARVPYARTYTEFSGTTTNPLYLAYSGAAPAASDQVDVCGMFEAVLGVSATFLWSLPVGNKVISKPIYETDWLTWVPTYAATAGMTFTGTSTTEGVYRIRGREVQLDLYATGTVGGVVSPACSFTVPLPRISTLVGALMGMGFGYYPGITYVLQYCVFEGASATVVDVSFYDGGNWAAGAGAIACHGQYRI